MSYFMLPIILLKNQMKITSAGEELYDFSAISYTCYSRCLLFLLILTKGCVFIVAHPRPSMYLFLLFAGRSKTYIL